LPRDVLAALVMVFALAPLTGCTFGVISVPQLSGTGRVHPALESKPIPAGLGVNIHFYDGRDGGLPMLAQAGIDMVRKDVLWHVCETAPGRYDFSRPDRLIADLESLGLGLMLGVEYGNPLYDDGEAPRTEECRKAYARFCAALVRRYAGKNVIWELWNEPNLDIFWVPASDVDQYIAWCKAVVPAILQADPNACIVGPALGRCDFVFLEQCFQRGLLDLIDGVTVHPYRGGLARYPKTVEPKQRLPLRSDPESALRDYDRIRALIERYKPAGKRIPILSGEWGYSTTYVDRALQGKYLARQWLANMAYGVPISLWYDWHDDGAKAGDMEHNFGTVTHDYKPKPAYVAMGTLIAELRGYTVVGRVKLASKNDFAVVFAKGDARKLAIWTRGEPHDVVLGAGIRVSGAVDHLGRPIDVPTGSRQQVTDAPRYLTICGPTPLWLEGK